MFGAVIDQQRFACLDGAGGADVDVLERGADANVGGLGVVVHGR